MFKKVFTSCLLLLLTISIPACSLNTAGEFLKPEDVDSSNLLGAWKMDKNIYIFEENGQLYTPTRQDIAGATWAIQGNQLILSFFDSPATPAHEEIWTFVKLSSSRMVLENPEQERFVWSHTSTKLDLVEGEFFFLERLGLPPEILVHVKLEQDNMPVASSLAYKAGALPIPFKIYYSEDNLKSDKPLKLSASLYYNENALFTTEEAISIPEGSERVEPIRLIHSTPDMTAPQPLVAPLAYSFSGTAQSKDISANLYLEENNLFFLVQYGIEKSKSFTWGRWNQVNRGHSIELLPYNGSQIQGSILENNNLSFDILPNFQTNYPMSFTETSSRGQTTRSLDLTGTLSKQGNQYSFTPCGITNAYPLQGKVSLLQNSMDTSSTMYAHIEAQYTSDAQFILQSVADLSEISLCEKTQVATSLENTYWRLNSLNDAKPYPSSESELHLILRREEGSKMGGEGSGSDGCNAFFVNWEVPADSSNVLDIALGGSTMRLCHDEEVNTQARNYLQALDKVNAFSIHGSMLELKQDNNVIATFEAVAL